MSYKMIEPSIFKCTITENYSSDNFEDTMKEIIDVFEISEAKTKCILFGNAPTIYKLIGDQFHIDWFNDIQDTFRESQALSFRIGTLKLLGYDILIISDDRVSDSGVYIQFAIK